MTRATPFTLVQGTYRTVFTQLGEAVSVLRYCRGERLRSDTLSLTAGRQLWAELVRKGWTRF